VSASHVPSIGGSLSCLCLSLDDLLLKILDFLAEVVDLRLEDSVFTLLIFDDLLLSALDLLSSLLDCLVLFTKNLELSLYLLWVLQDGWLLTRESLLKHLPLLVPHLILLSKELGLSRRHDLNLLLQIFIHVLDALELGHHLLVVKTDRNGRLPLNRWHVLWSILKLLQELALLGLEEVGTISELRELGVSL